MKKRFNEKTMKGIIYYCQVCSKEIYPFEGAVICKECYNKHKKQVDAMLKKIREKVENEVQI
jgi:hypothetical protein